MNGRSVRSRFSLLRSLLNCACLSRYSSSLNSTAESNFVTATRRVHHAFDGFRGAKVTFRWRPRADAPFRSTEFGCDTLAFSMSVVRVVKELGDFRADAQMSAETRRYLTPCVLPRRFFVSKSYPTPCLPESHCRIVSSRLEDRSSCLFALNFLQRCGVVQISLVRPENRRNHDTHDQVNTLSGCGSGRRRHRDKDVQSSRPGPVR